MREAAARRAQGQCSRGGLLRRTDWRRGGPPWLRCTIGRTSCESMTRRRIPKPEFSGISSTRSPLGFRIPLAALVQTVAVAEYRNFRHAASAPVVSQSSPNRRINQLGAQQGRCREAVVFEIAGYLAGHVNLGARNSCAVYAPKERADAQVLLPDRRNRVPLVCLSSCRPMRSSPQRPCDGTGA